MTITNAINRITWRTKNGWKTNDNDVTAINTIIDFVNKQQSKQINDLHLFAKLYIFVYGQFLKHYNTTVFDKIPKKEIDEILKQPVENLIGIFTQQLNDSELYKTFEDLGINMKHKATLLENQNRANTEILEKSTIDIQNIWSYEDVKECLESQINDAINRYD